jgi:hypothetical protein
MIPKYKVVLQLDDCSISIVYSNSYINLKMYFLKNFGITINHYQINKLNIFERIKETIKKYIEKEKIIIC